MIVTEAYPEETDDDAHEHKQLDNKLIHKWTKDSHTCRCLIQAWKIFQVWFRPPQKVNITVKQVAQNYLVSQCI